MPNIISDKIRKLKELHIDSVAQLAVQIPTELALKFGDNNVDAQIANRLVANARKVLAQNESLFSTADQILDKRNKITRYAR